MPAGPLERVRIARSAIVAIEAHADRDAPLECCGVLLGRGDAILKALAVRNIARDPSRFDADPLELVRAERKARQAELQVLGYYHSHPAGDPLPSSIDRQSVPWPDLPPDLHLIIAPGRGWAIYNTRNGAWSTVHVEVIEPESPAERDNA